jgi:hypothetical protein
VVKGPAPRALTAVAVKVDGATSSPPRPPIR